MHQSYKDAKARVGWADNKKESVRRAHDLLDARHAGGPASDAGAGYARLAKRDDAADASLLASWYVGAHGGICAGHCEAMR